VALADFKSDGGAVDRFAGSSILSSSRQTSKFIILKQAKFSYNKPFILN